MISKEDILASLIDHEPDRLAWWIDRGWEESDRDDWEGASLIKRDPAVGGLSVGDRQWIADQLIASAAEDIRRALRLPD